MSDNGDFDDFEADEATMAFEEEEEATQEDDLLDTGDDTEGYSALGFQQYETDVLEETLQASKKTLPILTKYERARIIGLRAQQIARGAPLYIDRGLETEPIRLAEMELVERKLPFIVRRRLPNDSFEDWKLSELTILDEDRK
jgi:DNA-directed RNA polymerases I, II, and III subunit RPABC2